MTSVPLAAARTERSCRSTWAVLVVAGLMMAACGAGKDKVASQAAARVNKEEITVHQINFVLQHRRDLAPEQTEAASREILERLIDQELAVQKADDLALGREPRVLQHLDAMRREVLARAYAEKIGESAPRPTQDEIRSYYRDNPALFSQRRIYNVLDISIEAAPQEVAALRARLTTLRNLDEFTDYLKSAKLRFTTVPAVRAAEQLPLALLGTFSALKEGQSVLSATPSGAQVVLLTSSRPAPVSEDQARAAIEQFLFNERKRSLVEQDRRVLRAAAAIQYMGKFAEGQAPSGLTVTGPAGNQAGTGAK